MSDPTMVLSQVASQLVRRAKTGGAVAAEVLLEQRSVLTMRSMGAGVGGGRRQGRGLVGTHAERLSSDPRGLWRVANHRM